jgi:hypothetical protein
MNQLNAFPTIVEQIPFEVGSSLRGGPFQKHVQFKVICDLVRYENKIETTNGIHSLNLLGESNFEGVQKPSQKDHLSIDVACIKIQVLKIKREFNDLV